MNENPYASPAETVVEVSEEEILKIKSRRMMWGLSWILASAVLMVSIFLNMVIGFSGILWPNFALLDLLVMLLYASAIGIPVAQAVGLFFCCFCPERLVKRGRLYVIVSVGILLAAVALVFLIPLVWTIPAHDDRRFVEENLFFIGAAISILVWQVFLLRLARGLDSTAGKRLTWGLLSYFILLAVGMIVYTNIDIMMTYGPGYGHSDPRWEPWREIGKIVDTLGYFVWFGYVILYAILLETLRRRIRQVMKEHE